MSRAKRRWLVLATIVAAVLVMATFVYGITQHRRSSVTATSSQPPKQLSLPSDVELPPAIPSSTGESSIPLTCGQILPRSAVDSIEKASILYASFPMHGDYRQLLVQLKPLVLPAFYGQVEQAWRASTAPQAWALKARTTACTVGDQTSSLQELRITLTVDVQSGDGSVSPVILPYSVFVVRLPLSYVVAGICPAGTCVSPVVAP